MRFSQNAFLLTRARIRQIVKTGTKCSNTQFVGEVLLHLCLSLFVILLHLRAKCYYIHGFTTFFGHYLILGLYMDLPRGPYKSKSGRDY